jgi:hypothetical protein
VPFDYCRGKKRRGWALWGTERRNIREGPMGLYLVQSASFGTFEEQARIKIFGLVTHG